MASSCRKSCLKQIRADEESSENDTTTGSDSSCSKKQVGFDQIVVMSFPIVLGDNPAVSSGAPIQIGWKHHSEQVHDVEIYEYFRPSAERRSGKALSIPSPSRTKILLTIGCSLDDIVFATMKAEEIKAKRYESMRANKYKPTWPKFSVVLENTSRALRVLVQGPPRIPCAKTA